MFTSGYKIAGTTPIQGRLVTAARGSQAIVASGSCAAVTGTVSLIKPGQRTAFTPSLGSGSGPAASVSESQGRFEILCLRIFTSWEENRVTDAPNRVHSGPPDATRKAGPALEAIVLSRACP
jgi:hypothetical protein